jgi:tetratricopeptide (TPR) repeat protein
MRRFLISLTILSALLSGCVDVDVDAKPYVDEYRRYRDAYEVVVPPVSTGPMLSPAGPQATVKDLERQVLKLYSDGEYAKAQTVMEQIVKLQGEVPGHWFNLACLQSRNGKTGQAIASLRKALDLGYDDLDRLRSDEDLDALRKRPGYRDLVQRLTRAKKQDGKTEQAEADKDDQDQEEAQQESRRFAALFRESMKHFREKKWSQARDAVRKMLKLRPDHSVTWYNLACAESRLGNLDAACDALDQAFDHGYADFNHMQRDPDLSAIRKTPRYRGLLARREQIQRGRAEMILEALKENHGDDYLYDVDHETRLVFATDVDRRMLDELKEFLVDYATIQRRDLFESNFDQYVTVVVPRQWKNRTVGGFYSHNQRTLTARSMGMVMTHEFTHALHFGDQDALGQRHPIWITEGLATLFETSRIQDDKIVPLDNYRLILLKRLLARKKTLGFEKIAGLSHKQFMRNSTVGYSQVRYMFKYLYEKGVLKQWYDAYLDGYENDSTGIDAMEQVLGKDVEQIEKDWAKWVVAQKSPPVRIRPNQAYIGIRMASVKDGLQLVQVVEGSGADKAGLKKGDVLVRVGDLRVVDSSDLVLIVSQKDVGDTIDVEFRRGEDYRKVQVTLGAMPRRIPRNRRKK